MHLTSEDYKQIKEAVGMRQAAAFYGYPVDRQGRCLCPFHNDKHPSMKIYPQNKGYYCFVCNEGGDVIKFVAKIFGLSNEDAAKRLIADFGIPVKLGDFTYREKRERDKKLQKRMDLQRFSRYTEALLRFYRIRLCRAALEPSGPHFAEAMQMLSIVEYRLECIRQHPEEMKNDRKVGEWIGTVERRLSEWDAAVTDQ